MNPEQAVLDSIDALVNESLEREITDDYCSPWHDVDGNVECALCGGEWHGLSTGLCPGAWATEEQRIEYEERRAHRRNSLRHERERYYRWHSGPDWPFADSVVGENFVQFGEFQVRSVRDIPHGHVFMGDAASLLAGLPLTETGLQVLGQLDPEGIRAAISQQVQLMPRRNGRASLANLYHLYYQPVLPPSGRIIPIAGT